MNEIKILIRFDDDKQFGFVIDRDAKDKNNQTEVAKLLMALEVIKHKEISRLEKIKSYKTEY